ncbi:MAG: phosphatidate cytidylyltransferase [Planctomycetes bacterium]|nr:phosphatidate cytidylyltransferase [Planctomycetota bacterium]
MISLGTRIIFGTAMLGAFFGVLYLDYIFNSDIGLGLVAILAGTVGLLEFYNIAAKNGSKPFKIIGLISGVLVFVGYWMSVRGLKASSQDLLLTKHSFHLISSGPLVLLVLLLFLLQGITRDLRDAAKNISITVFGILYVFFLLSFVMLIRHLPAGNGLQAVMTVLLISKGGDIGAYLFGSKFGRHKLSPTISPKKSIEGAAFGLFLGLLIAVGLSISLSTRILPFPWVIPFSLIVGVAAMFGDLAESILKRDANVKDASNSVPAFGGMLDIIDCMLFSLPVSYYFLAFYQAKY